MDRQFLVLVTHLGDTFECSKVANSAQCEQDETAKTAKSLANLRVCVEGRGVVSNRFYGIAGLLTSGSQVRVLLGSSIKSSTYGHPSDARFALHTLSHTHSLYLTHKLSVS